MSCLLRFAFRVNKFTFGNTIYVHFLGKELIILGSLSAAKELLDKRGATYSDRPRLVLYQEMLVGCTRIFYQY